VDAMNWLAGVLRQQGKDEEADGWMDKAYRIDPFNSAIVSNLANRSWQEGDPDRAERMLRRMLDLPEPPIQAMVVLWDLYFDTGRLVEASQIGRQLLLAGGWQTFFLAQTYATLGEPASAAEWISDSVRHNPDVMWVRTGWVQAQVPYWNGHYDQAAEAMRRAMASTGLSLDELDSVLVRFYGVNQSLSADLSGAITTLAEILPDTVDPSILDGPYGQDAYQALAWAYLQSGLSDQSKRPLEIVEQWFAEHSASIAMIPSDGVYVAARNAVLTGDNELALDRLEQAVDLGWRDYYTQRHDPRWSALADDPRYQALMEKVKADVDRQRAEVEKIDAEEDFPALLEQARARRAAASP
jgi:tetratricopeptide (TPR) repeat protein